MTKERIEDFREIVLPFLSRTLLKTNYENMGKSDAEEFEKDFNEILDLAIKALEQETVSRESYDHEYFLRKELEMKIAKLEHDKNKVLNKIRAEILEEKEHAYADFERYKVEYLGQDWEDALDSLPQDDFRYGMERTIELIDKYKSGTEE